MSDDKNLNDENQNDENAAGGESSAATRPIAETSVDLTGIIAATRDSAAATEKIRAARGQTSRTRPREEAVDLTAARASASTTAAEPAAPPSRRRTGRESFSLAITLWLIAAVIGGIAAVLAWHPGVSGTANRAFVNGGETSEVISQLSDKACRPFSYDWQKLPESVGRAAESMTGTAKAEFEKSAETNRKIIAQTRADSDCHVDTVGVAELTDDSAVLLATLIISVNSDGQAVENVSPRLQYTMVKEHDQWLVSEVADVG